MFAIGFVIEMVMLQKYLPHRVTAVDEIAVSLHQNGLSLRGVIGFDVVGRPRKLLAVSMNIIQSAYNGRAA